MSPQFRRVALIAASLGLLVSLFVALRGRGEETTDAAPTVAATTETAPEPGTTEEPTTTAEPPPPPPRRPARVTVRLRVVGGRPVGGIRRPEVEQGRQVVIVTIADVADHVHLHGYDLQADVAPGSPARLRFRATLPGRFEIELEDRGIQIADLTVTP